jgi:ribonuclease R
VVRKPREGGGPAHRAARGLPSKADIVSFLQSADRKTGKREIAKAFGVKGDERQALKALIREMSDEGLIACGRKKRVAAPGKLPPVTLLDIIDRDTDGELIAKPARWEMEEPAPLIVLAPGDAGAGPGPALGIGERVLARLTRLPEGESRYAYEARIIRRLGQSAHRVLGLYRGPSGRAREGRIVPVDRKSRFELLVRPEDVGEARSGDLVFAELKSHPGREGALGLKPARITERLGSLDDPRSISLIAVHMHGIPTEFPAAALKEAEAVREPGLKGRRDLRDLPLITIDPEDARDHDDAVFAHPDDDPQNPGGWVAWVAIADVAHFVTPDSALDREALKRGNSAYFPDRVIPMLPERLSAGLCSLEAEKDRACLAVRMVFDQDGEKRSHQFARGLMRSPASLTYQQVQAAMDGYPDAAIKPLVEPVIRPLYTAFAALEKAREKRSPLDFDLPEFKIELGKDGKVHAIGTRTRLTAHRLIEEFMIQANVAAAETLEGRRQPVMYRVHEPPAREKLIALSEFLDTIGVKIQKGQTLSPRQFNQILRRAQANEMSQMVSEIVLRTQTQAYYGPRNQGHFGLHLQRYAHFTSPIRRYADLLVHRALIRGLDLGHDGLTEIEIENFPKIGEEISHLERRAMAAERDSNDRYIASFMQDRLGAEFEGRISGVTRFGLFVKLSETGADGLVPIAGLGREFFHHDERAHALIGGETGLTFRLGGSVTVRLIEAAPVTGGLRFELLTGGVPGERGSTKRGRKTSRPKPRGGKLSRSKRRG